MVVVFVPRAPDLADDGYLMTFVSDLASDSAEIVLLHAQDLEVARGDIKLANPVGTAR